MADSLDLYAASAALSQLLLSVLLLHRVHFRNRSYWLFITLLFSVACFLLMPFFEDRGVKAALASISTLVPGCFWLLCASLFNDSFNLKPWHLAVVFYTFISPIIAKILGLPQYDGVLIDLPQALELVLLTFALWEVVKYWQVDLSETRRKLRLWFCTLNGTYIFLFILFRSVLFPDAQWLQTIDYLLAGLMLFCSNAILLKYVSGVFGRVEAGVAVNPQNVAVDFQEQEQNVSQQHQEKEKVDKELLAKLQEMVVQKKVYKKMSLTIGDLAHEMGIQEYRLRKLINEGLGYRNFNDFLNRFRVVEAAQKIQSDTEQSQTILQISTDVGFRSLSSFNKAFKASYGKTPTIYRKEALSNSKERANY